MNFSKIILSIIILINFSSCAQSKITKTDSVFIKETLDLVDKTLKSEIKGNKHIVFAMGNDSQLVLVEEPNSYKEYFIHKSNGNREISKIDYSKPNEFYEAMFDEKQYHQKTVTFESDLYKDGYETAQGNKTYFALRSENEKYGESVLSVFVKPNPIKAETYNYFVTKLLEHIRNNQ